MRAYSSLEMANEALDKVVYNFNSAPFGVVRNLLPDYLPGPRAKGMLGENKKWRRSCGVHVQFIWPHSLVFRSFPPPPFPTCSVCQLVEPDEIDCGAGAASSRGTPHR